MIYAFNATVFKGFKHKVESQFQLARCFHIKFVQILKRFFYRFIVLKIDFSRGQFFLVLQQKVKAKKKSRVIVFQIGVMVLVIFAFVLVASVPI